MSVSDLPHLNASLNALATVLLLLGRLAIWRRAIELHKRLMVAAFSTSVLFLLSYVIYHANAGSVKFTGTGLIRPIYFALLLSHIVLAALVPFLASMTLYRGLRGHVEQHRRLAVWTWPIWMYVSLTGVAVYVLLYHLYPAGHA